MRNGKPFSSFIEVMKFIIENEGALGLFKGIGPQILKGLLVQGILMMTKERYVGQSLLGYKRQVANRSAHRVELMFVLLLRYLKTVRIQQLRSAAQRAAQSVTPAAPLKTSN